MGNLLGLTDVRGGYGWGFDNNFAGVFIDVISLINGVRGGVGSLSAFCGVGGAHDIPFGAFAGDSGPFGRPADGYSGGGAGGVTARLWRRGRASEGVVVHAYTYVTLSMGNAWWIALA
ncbi:hypothetical protein D1007_29939 [Hordeum vulgare]|nr:hypothetical protein D1007_29939 [Hordeum vulgare]